MKLQLQWHEALPISPLRKRSPAYATIGRGLQSITKQFSPEGKRLASLLHQVVDDNNRRHLSRRLGLASPGKEYKMDVVIVSDDGHSPHHFSHHQTRSHIKPKCLLTPISPWLPPGKFLTPILR